MTPASPPRSGPRPGAIALLLAWLLLFGVLGAAAGYVFLVPPQQAGESATAEALAPDAGETPAGQPAPPDDALPGPQAAGPAEIPAPEDGEPAMAETAPPPAPPQAAEAEAAPEPPRQAAPEPAAQPAPEPPPAAPSQAEPAPSATAESEPAEDAPAAGPSAEDQVAALPKPLEPALEPPWRRNSQPFDAADSRPRVAVVLTGLGLASATTEAAIKTLPGEITLSFTPYSRKLSQWIALARVNGHEVMLDLPMEPTSYPDDDPGPQALLTALSAAQNLERLDWALERATGYVGVAAVMGSRFLASQAHMTPILEELKARGLMFLDNRASDDSVATRLAAEIGVPRARNDRALDWAQASRVAIDARLVQLENVARAQGFAVAMGRPYPVTVERLRDWASGLEERGLVLAPISALANRQPLRKTAQSSAKPK